MKGQQQSTKPKNTLAKIQFLQKPHNLRSLLLEYQQEGYRKQDTIKNITSRSSKVFYSETEVVSKNQKITMRFDKNKDMYLTEIVLTEKTTKYISDDDLGFGSDKFCDHNDIDEEIVEKYITQKVQEVIKTLQDHCKQKELDVPKQITVEAMILHLKIYSFMFYTLSAKFRLLPMFTCSMDQLDDLITEDAPKAALSDLIRKQFKELLKQLIESSDIISALFKLLRTPDFPVSRFTNKRKMVFLLMLAEAVLPKKKRNNKKKNKKKNTEAGDKVKSQLEQQEETESFQEVLDKIERLSNESDKYMISLSAEFINNLAVEVRKIKA